MITQALRTPFLPLWITAVIPFGCSSSINPIETNISYGPDDRFATRILDGSERDQVIEIMQESVDGPTDDPARPAPHGTRWNDVRLAAVKAGGVLELAILSVDDEEDGMVKRIRMVSIGEVPVELVVRRMPPPAMYEASATAGLFQDQQALADDLVVAFGAAMRAYGAKPGWDGPALD